MLVESFSVTVEFNGVTCQLGGASFWGGGASLLARLPEVASNVAYSAGVALLEQLGQQEAAEAAGGNGGEHSVQEPNR